ncbi:MAG TPA: glycine cleavage system protein H [Syntrophobacteraceae bacterium]|nr:glycine cleavage system protein H [Syntrophobacteraceae bacterium]
MKNVNGLKGDKRIRVFSTEDRQCVWMKAGVVNYKLCDQAFDCLHCPFDKAMSRTKVRKPGAVSSWRRAMRTKPYKEKECRHMLTGRVQYHFCSNGYRCNVCEYDQYLDEADLAEAMGTIHTSKIAGFTVAHNYYYHRGHGWARVEHGGFVRLGMDDFALRLLGRPTEIRLPKLGSRLEQTEVGWSIRRDRESAEVLSPIDGLVVATNHKAVGDPHQVKTDPYGAGWLIVVEPQGLKSNLKNLLFEREAAAWVKAEREKLEHMVMASQGFPLAATGGEIVDDVFGNLPQMKWEDLVHEFLLT